MIGLESDKNTLYVTSTNKYPSSEREMQDRKRDIFLVCFLLEGIIKGFYCECRKYVYIHTEKAIIVQTSLRKTIAIKWYLLLQSDFFNWASPENVSRLAPPINPSTGPPLNLLRMRITKHLRLFSIIRGGQSGTLTFFLKSVTYWPTLSKFRGGPVKKTPCILLKYIFTPCANV